MSDQSTLGEFGGADVLKEAETDPVDDNLYKNEVWLRGQYCEQEKTMTEIRAAAQRRREQL